MSDGYSGDAGNYFGALSVGSKAEAPPDRIDVYKLPSQETRDILPSLLQGDSVGLVSADAVSIYPRNPGVLRYAPDEHTNPDPPQTGVAP